MDSTQPNSEQPNSERGVLSELAARSPAVSPRKCVTLLSGGLDSMLAVRIMQEHGIEVEALNFKTMFTCCQDQAGQAARELGVRLTIVAQEDDYLDLIKYPRFGYGKGANPCIDCRIYMFRKAKQFMEQVGASFIVSGEVLGQRPKSQKRNDLMVIAFHAGLEDLLLRPLCAKLLPPTLPEREGWVDRERLYGIMGRSRKELMELAARYGLKEIPTPSTGCALTEPLFAPKVFDLVELQPAAGRWDFDLLTMGRHFRIDNQTKVIVGRNEVENEQLRYAHFLPDASSSAYLQPRNFNGPTALVIGPLTESTIEFAGGLALRYSKDADRSNALVDFVTTDGSQVVQVRVSDAARDARTVSSV